MKVSFHLLVVFCCISLTVSSFAQGKTYNMPGEVQALFAQANEVISNRPKADSAFVKGESAAVEYNVSFESYDYSGGRWKIAKHSRFAVRIMDQSALEAFSTIDAPENRKSGSGYLGAVFKINLTLRIIKGKDNRVVDISSEELSENSNGQIAVPGLEVGDRLEIIKDSWINVKSQFMTCGGLITESFKFEYPVLFGYKRLSVHKALTARIKMAEDAPRYKLNKSLSEKKVKVYDLTYTNLPKRDDEIWAKPYEELAKITYEVCLNRHYKPRDQIFLPGQLDTLTSEQRAKDLVLSKYY